MGKYALAKHGLEVRPVHHARVKSAIGPMRERIANDGSMMRKVKEIERLMSQE